MYSKIAISAFLRVSHVSRQINSALIVQRQPPWPVATTSLSGGSDWRTG
jgi:hypothetical protein